MCKMASGVLTKGHKAHWSKGTDSHEAIIAEHKLTADGVRGPNIVRFEITPPDDRYDAPLAEWSYRVDQDTTPDWYDATAGEVAARAMLVEWAVCKLVTTGIERDVNTGENVVVCGGTVNKVCGGTVDEVCGGTVNEVWGGTVNAVCGGTVNEGWGGTVNEVCGGTVEFRVAFACKLTGALAVVINRIGAKAKCYVGTAKTRTVTGK